MFSLGVRRVSACCLRPTYMPRAFCTSSVFQKPLELAYEVQQPPSTDKPVAEKTNALVVCHGLYGSKQNWRSIAKAMAKEFGVPIYSLDLRNHGTSPHADSMTYSDMAGDIRKFISDKQPSRVALIGHSMGGKAVMSVALDPELQKDTLSHLVSVDMSPAEGRISPEFMKYAQCMVDINNMNVKSRSEADKVLQEVEPDMPVRQFLLTNLEQQGDAMRFKIPVESIMQGLQEIGNFPYAPPAAEGASPERQWDGPTLFVKGAHSKYINRRNIPLCKAYFPNMELVTLETGHWCQSEAPGPFMDAVKSFLLK